ncbi:hypothetical protein SK128_013511 [Halocaridina rubra]|uniref:Uncharacterized protein n=1 Tax=Halocaridina rubra TaxID=373956 RepID=A0AAN8WNG5_HALRR
MTTFSKWATVLLSALLLLISTEGMPSKHAQDPQQNPENLPQAVQDMMVQQLCSVKDIPDCENQVHECVNMTNAAHHRNGEETDVEVMCPEMSSIDCYEKILRCSEIMKPPRNRGKPQGIGMYEEGLKGGMLKEGGEVEGGAQEEPLEEPSPEGAEEPLEEPYPEGAKPLEEPYPEGAEEPLEEPYPEGTKPLEEPYPEGAEEPYPEGEEEEGPYEFTMMTNMEKAEYMCSTANMPNCTSEVLACFDLAMMVMPSGNPDVISAPDVSMCVMTDVPDCEMKIITCNALMQEVVAKMKPLDNPMAPSENGGVTVVGAHIPMVQNIGQGDMILSGSMRPTQSGDENSSEEYAGPEFEEQGTSEMMTYPEKNPAEEDDDKEKNDKEEPMEKTS